VSLDKSFFTRNTSITAKVICDSISEQGIRLTTFEIEYPRIVMSEFNTMRAISKNSSSSRAIPVSKMLEHTKNINLKPVYFGSKKSGMQAGDELLGVELEQAKGVWEASLRNAVESSEMLDNLGVAKEVTNRLVEPFQLVKVVCTATDWDNFFNLRLHPDADPNICMLAYKMYKAMQESKPIELKVGEWHLPYVDTVCAVRGDKNESCKGYCHPNGYDFLKLEDAIKLSAASCASVSYRTEGTTLEKADKIFDMLIKADVLHSSPMEHQATPIGETKIAGLTEYESLIEHLLNKEGVTHINKNFELCSGNLRGYIQYRHLLPNNTSWSFDFEKRMELFK